MTRKLAGKAGKPPAHVQCESVRRVTKTGAPSPQATPVPRTVSACTATVCAAAVRTGGSGMFSPYCVTSIMGVRAGSP